MGILLFWPAIALSLVTSAVGIRRRAPRLLLLGAAFSLPAALYLAASPRFGAIALLLPMCHVGGAVALAKRLPWVPALSLLAFAGFFVWLGLSIARRDPKAPLPPAPTVSAVGVAVPVVRNQHCWDDGKVCAENLTPTKLVEAKGMTPTAVPPGALLRLAFPVPPRHVRVDRWEANVPRPSPSRTTPGRLRRSPGSTPTRSPPTGRSGRRDTRCLSRCGEIRR